MAKEKNCLHTGAAVSSRFLETRTIASCSSGVIGKWDRNTERTRTHPSTYDLVVRCCSRAVRLADILTCKTTVGEDCSEMAGMKRDRSETFSLISIFLFRVGQHRGFHRSSLIGWRPRVCLRPTSFTLPLGAGPSLVRELYIQRCCTHP